MITQHNAIPFTLGVVHDVSLQSHLAALRQILGGEGRGKKAEETSLIKETQLQLNINLSQMKDLWVFSTQTK